MTPPTVQFIPALNVSVIGFTSAVTSPGKEFNVDHTNIVGDSWWDGRGLTNSIDLLGNLSPDVFDMYFSNDTERNTALASFSSFELFDASDIVTYTLTTSSISFSRIRFQAQSGADAVWVNGNDYILKGQP